MILYILLKVKFQPFLICHILESCLFVPCYHGYQGNIFHQNRISTLIRHCFFNRWEERQLKSMRKCEEHDHYNNQSQKLKRHYVVLVVSHDYLSWKLQFSIQNVVLIDKMAIFGQLVPRVVLSWEIVGLNELCEIKDDKSNDQWQYEYLDLCEKGNNLTADPILHLPFIHLCDFILCRRCMHFAHI